MSCIEASDESKLPTLLCEFVQGNEEHKIIVLIWKTISNTKKQLDLKSDNQIISFLIRGKQLFKGNQHWLRESGIKLFENHTNYFNERFRFIVLPQKFNI